MSERITRRKFMSSSAMAVGGAAAASMLGENRLNAEERNIKWAFGMYTWVVFHRPNPVPVMQMMDETKSVGFHGLEFFDHRKMLAENDLSVERLKAVLEEKGLEFVSVYFAAAFHDRTKHADILRDLRATCSDFNTLGADRLVVGPPGYKGEDEKGTIREMARFLDEAGKIALEEYGIKMCMHPHLNTLIENPRQTCYFLDATDPRYVFFVPDTGHMWLGGADPVKVMSDYRDRIAYVHYKDAKGFVVKPGFFDNVVELGRGDIDFPAAHRILKDISYKGWVTIDLDFVKESPLASARIHADYVSSVLDPIYK